MLPTLLSAVLSAPPTPTPAPGGCVRGRDGVPDSPLGHLMCGDYLVHAPHTVWLFARSHGPLLLTAAAVVVAARIGWLVWRRHRWRRATQAAVWLEIVPPVTATPAATVALWQLLATVLPAARRWTACPHRLVWEVHATPTGMRCGLWVPPGINPTAVVRALHRAWPGVRATHAPAPVMAPERPVVGVALRSTQPDWLPLVDDPDPPPTSRLASTPEADRIRAVFDGLAAAGRTGGGLLQVHVARAPRHRLGVLRRAAAKPPRAHRHRGGTRVLILAVEALRTTVSGVLDLLTPGSSASRAPSGRTDPVVAEQARQARAKHAASPHLLVAIWATATGPTTAAARAAAADITSGYSLLSPHWRPRRIRRPAAAAQGRWMAEAQMQVAAAVEAAAVAGLPVEPSAYGLPSAASRRLPPTRDTFTPPVRRVRESRPGRIGRGDGDSEENDDPGRKDGPAVWSTP